MPFLYLASTIPVIISLIVVLTFVEYNIGFRGYEPGLGLDGFTTLYFDGDLIGMVALVLIGGPVFGLCSWGVTKLERTRQPSITDHLRHCVFLYAFVVIVGASFVMELVGNFVSGDPMHEGPKAVIFLVAAGYAILIDALILIRQGRRSIYSNSRSLA